VSTQQDCEIAECLIPLINHRQSNWVQSQMLSLLVVLQWFRTSVAAAMNMKLCYVFRTYDTYMYIQSGGSRPTTIGCQRQF